MEILDTLHQIESRIGYDLDIDTSDRVIDYLRDDPVCTDIEYLIELFDLEGKTHIA